MKIDSVYWVVKIYISLVLYLCHKLESSIPCSLIDWECSGLMCIILKIRPYLFLKLKNLVNRRILDLVKDLPSICQCSVKCRQSYQNLTRVLEKRWIISQKKRLKKKICGVTHFNHNCNRNLTSHFQNFLNQ